MKKSGTAEAFAFVSLETGAFFYFKKQEGMTMAKRKKRTINGAQLSVQILIEQGVDTVFGYPGGMVVDLYDALYQSGDKIRHILTAHEQGAAHAADGYARATGKTGVVIATSGPGATNLVTGLATAMLDSVPMVAITGNVPTWQIGKDAFQEINITGITLPITKHNYFVQDVNELADTIREAFQIAKSGRPGPVLIDIPKDIQLAACSYEPQPVVDPFNTPKVPENQIKQAVALLQNAKRPYLYVGGGAAACGLGEQVLLLAEKLDAFIGCSLMGLSAIPRKESRFLGMEGMHGALAATLACKQADLIFGIGVRFSDRATGNTDRFGKDAVILQLDTDLSEINKNVKVTLGMIGDITEALFAIVDAVAPQSHPLWQQTVASLKEQQTATARKVKAEHPASLCPAALIDVVNETKDDDTIIATDVGQHQMWTAQSIELSRPRKFISSGGLGTMGFGLGAAIGASIGTGCRAILVTGDGSFGMNLTELATAVTYGVPVVIVLLNNGTLGLVRQTQRFFFGGRYAETTLNRRTDFVRVAEAFGADARRVTNLDAFRAALQTALQSDRPTLIEVPVDIDEPVLPMRLPGGAVDELITDLSQEELS